ncbi:MAG: hypothetical protein H6719_31825 [Sandaracinaceae bacterium]|nr:hypothetical protein [Sandaracinaceae bacterium]
MTERLIQRWRDEAKQVATWQSGDDPEPVLDVLALTVALELTGDLGRVARDERDALRKVGQRALLQLGGADRDEEELEALRMCATIARDGLRALGGRPLPDEPTARDVRVVIPPGDLTRLLRGQLDGFAAGTLAMRVRRSEAAMAELRTLNRLEAPAAESRFALAAAEAAAVIDPAAGRLLGTHPTLGVEAVLFEDGEVRLALYAEEPDPLRLVAPELTTVDVREGYWIGRVAEGTSRVVATLHVGERSEPWELSW